MSTQIKTEKLIMDLAAINLSHLSQTAPFCSSS